MKKIMMLAAGLLVCAGAWAQPQEKIQLPQRSAQRGLPLMKTFEERKSSSDFGDKMLSSQDLGDLLWAATGFNRADKRTNATAMNAQEIDVYVCLEEGSYLYNAKEHALELVGTDDIRPAVGRGADAKKPPLCLIIVADMSRSPLLDNQPEAAHRMAAYDAGIVSQNIYMFCAGNGLGTRCRAGMDHAPLRAGLGLGELQVIHLNHPVGYLQ